MSNTQTMEVLQAKENTFHDLPDGLQTIISGKGGACDRTLTA